MVAPILVSNDECVTKCPYVCANLRRRVPNPYDLDVAGDQELPLALKPIQDQSYVLGARNEVGQAPERCD